MGTVSASTGLPLADACLGNAIVIRGHAFPDGTRTPVARLCAVSEGYVKTLGMRLVGGRDLERADVDGSRTNVLVNEAFVTTVLGGVEALGRQIRSSAPPPQGVSFADGNADWAGAPPWLTVVGVVANTPFENLTERTPVAVVYMPFSIAGGPDIPCALLGPSISAMTYVVRPTVSPAGLTSAVQRSVRAVDRSLAIAQVLTLQGLVDGGAAPMALTMALLVIAASRCARDQRAIGIYGVIAYVVSQRRGEIGVRLALGASPGTVVLMIAKQAPASSSPGLRRAWPWPRRAAAGLARCCSR